MKIEREYSKFNPIIIRIDEEREAKLLYDALKYSYMQEESGLFAALASVYRPEEKGILDKPDQE